MSKQLDFTAGLGFEWLCRIPVFPRFCIMTFAYGKGDLQKSFDFRGKQFFFFFFFFFFSSPMADGGEREYATLYGCSITNQDQYQCHYYSVQWICYTLESLV